MKTGIAHVTVSEAPEILIDERRELGKSAFISLAPMRQELGHFLGGKAKTYP